MNKQQVLTPFEQTARRELGILRLTVHLGHSQPGNVHQGDEEANPSAQVRWWRSHHRKSEVPREPNQVAEPRSRSAGCALTTTMHCRSEALQMLYKLRKAGLLQSVASTSTIKREGQREQVEMLSASFARALPDLQSRGHG